MDFVTTSINDSELLEQTYESYNKHITDINLKDCRLIINFDPIPDNNFSKSLDVCRKYFKHILVRISDKPNFTKGNLWCLDQVETDYFFYIQANKCLKGDISIEYAKNLFKNENNVVSISLSPINQMGYLDYLNWHPNIWKTQWIKEKYLKLSSNNISSEYQLREIGLLEKVKSKCYMKNNSSDFLLNHIGKKYKEKNNYFFGNISSDNEIKTILDKEGYWHEKIYNIYKNKLDSNDSVLNNFYRKCFGNKDKIYYWNMRWTGVFGYGLLDKKNYYMRHIIKNYSP